MATFSELQTRIRVWLRDLPADTSAEVPALINEAQRELQRQHNFRVMEAVASFVTTAASNALGTVADFKEPRKRPYWTDNDSSTHAMQWQPSLDYLIQRYQDDSVGEPLFIFWSALSGTDVTTLQVYPKSDSLSQFLDNEYRISVPYWKKLPALVGVNDTNWFTVNADKYLRLHALGQATLLNLDEQRAQIYMRAADVEAARLISADKMSRVQQPEAFPYSENAEAQTGGSRSWWSW